MTGTYTWTASASGGSWNDPANWDDLTTGTSPPPAPPGAADIATIGGGANTAFQILAGTGTAAALTLFGNTAIEGAVEVAALAIGGTAIPVPWSNSNAIDIEPNAVLAAELGIVSANLEDDGGALVFASSVTQTGTNDILLLNNAAGEAASWTIAGGNLYVDPTATLEIGLAGTDTTTGAVVIDPGALLTLANGIESVQDTIIDDGGIIATNPTSYGGANGDVQNVSGTGTIEVANGSGLDTGTLTALADILIDGNAILSTGDIINTGTIYTGDNALIRTGNLTNVAAIRLGDTVAAFFATITGTGSITAGASDTIDVNGTISGLAGIALGLGTTLQLAGNDINVPINLTGTNTLILAHASLAARGIAIGGAVTNFDTTDLIQSTTSLFPQGTGVYTTGAAAAGGTLTLSSDGTVFDSIALAGATQFLATIGDVVDVFGIPTDAVSDIALIGSVTTRLQPDSTGTVTGATGPAFDIIQGSATAASAAITFAGNTAIDGQITIGTLAVGTTATAASLDVASGGSLAVTDAALVTEDLEVNDAAVSIGGTLSIDGGVNPAQVAVVNHGRLTAAALSFTSVTNVFGSQSDLLVDPQGEALIGSGIAATPGAVAIAPGATVTADADGPTIIAAVIDDGLIEVTNTLDWTFPESLNIWGNLSGTGSVRLDPSDELAVHGNLTGLSAISIGQNSDLTVDGTLASSVALVTASAASVTITGDLAGLSLLQLAPGSNLDVEGNAILPGAILIGTGPNSAASGTSADFQQDVSGSAGIEVGSLGEVTITGTVSNVGSIVLDANGGLYLQGGDQGVTVILDGSDTLQVADGVPVLAPVAGFDASDLLQNIAGVGGPSSPAPPTHPAATRSPSPPTKRSKTS